MTKVQPISPESLPPVVWQDARVITTELLAKVYGTSSNNIKVNHSRNKARFVEGKHFYRIAGQDLKDLRVSLSNSQIPAKARSVILWTERGAMRHAKMLETDKAWEVFETLEDCYFTVRAKQAEGNLSTVMDRVPLYYFTVDTVLRHRLLFSRVYLLINLFAGSKRFKEMTKDQVSEVVEFCDRFALGQDTRSDWQRIVDNQEKLYGKPKQLDMVQRLLLS